MQIKFCWLSTLKQHNCKKFKIDDYNNFFSVQFWLCSSLTLSFMQCLAAVFMLPALLTAGQVLWFVCIVIPLLSVSLMGVKVDKSIMQKPLGKNQTVFSQEVIVWDIYSTTLRKCPHFRC